MAKKINAIIKLQLPAGAANPSPPVGPALGQHGVNIMEFCKAYTFITKTPPAAVLLVKAAKLQKGSGEPNKKKVGKVSMAQIEEIAKIKMPDLSAYDLNAACKTIMGTARSMGIEVE